MTVMYQFGRYTLVLAMFLMFIGCGDSIEEQIADELQVLAAPALVSDNCPALIYQNTSRMRLIPHGEFVMGGAPESKNHRTPEWTAETDGYWIDMHEVTVGDFMMFVDTTGYQTSEIRDMLLIDGQRPFERDNYADSQVFYSYPVQVTWEEADAYARWVGKRLPTEIEWEKAARGGIQGGQFSWGDTEPTVAPKASGRQTDRYTMASEGAFIFSMFDERAVHLWTGENIHSVDPDDEFFALQPVCSYAPNNYGLFDMIGNVDEWCADGWNENAYLLFMNGVEPVEQREFESVPLKVVRGGGRDHNMNMWDKRTEIDGVDDDKVQMFYESTIHVGERTKQPSWDYGFTGFRCVLDLTDSTASSVKSWKQCEAE